MLRYYHELDEDRPNPTGLEYRRLWSAVINQAMDDIRGVRDWHDKNSIHYKTIRGEHARAWFKSHQTGPCSFRWVCDALRLDPVRIRDRVLCDAKHLKSPNTAQAVAARK